MSEPGKLGLTDGRLADPSTTPNCVSSHADPNDKVHYIEPLLFDGSSEEATEAVLKTIEHWPRTKILKEDESYYHLVCTTLIFRFKDDLEIYIDEEKKEIHFRSASRIGYSDFGTNRRRVNAFKNQLKKVLGCS